MTSRLYLGLALATLMLGSLPAQAAITCSVASNGFFGSYNPALKLIVQTSFTVTCDRSASGDPTSVSYTNAADNGLYALGVNNRAFLSGTNYLKYDAYVDGSCGTQWKGNTTIAGTISFSGTGTVSKTHAYWGCVAAGQTGAAAGSYSDSVTMTLSYGSPTSTSTNTFPVGISTPATCSISTPPGTVAFGTYVAFGGALAASTGFGATCSNYLAYTLSVSPTSGTIAGVNYTLLLQNAAPVMSGTTLSVTGSGVQQSYTINGSMAAGQAGTCAAGSCSAAVPHTLTLSY